MLAPFSRPAVLVVDDDDAVRSALAFSLDLQGLDVTTFESGEALLIHDLPAAHACLVLDERLPGISGMETVRQLRDRSVALPAILVTTNPGPSLRAAAREAGVPIVEKPLLGDALVAAIRRALGT
ncbi:MAG: response regulator [Phenylobacterium zucineum]|nr:MAG: response regulator [Phenylobacterium zucineum]